MIVDDELYDQLVDKIPEGVRLTAILDCCHSGTALDLPYVYKLKADKTMEKKEEKKKKKKKNKKKDKKSDKKSNKSSEGSGKIVSAGGGKKSDCTCVMISGCQDDQVSADIMYEGEATGAVTFSFISALSHNQLNLTYDTLMRSMKEVLAKNTRHIIQCPQLSTNDKTFSFDEIFHC
eukprot:TRINITY_DN642_c0_g1_i2.p1 TRINITY_DN642_c0_g1~~TRINITY_DN642_c0_g1_i2.p1  ORF type:complete len:177 (+),score=67.21 TRINITY_DN642_c0_g1_i2:413-943(+)